MVDIKKIKGKWTVTNSVAVSVLIFIVFLPSVSTIFTDVAYGEEAGFTVDNIKYIHVNDQKVKVTGITQDYTSKNWIIIPNEIEKDGIKYEVAYVATGAFACCGNLTSIRIPDSIEFEVNAFGQLDNLSRVYIRGSEPTAIIDCSSLMTNLPGKINSIIIDSSAEINVSELINNKSVKTIYFTENAVNTVLGEELMFYDEHGEALTESKELLGKNFVVKEDDPYTWNQTPCSSPYMSETNNAIYIILAIIVPILFLMAAIIHYKHVQ